MLVIATCWPPSTRARAEEVSFEALWAHANERSPELAVVRSERAHARAADARVRGVLAENPTLVLEGGPRFQGSGRSYDLTAGLSQPVRVGGQRRSERSLADATRQRIEADIEEGTWALRQRLRAAYREAASARAHAELATAVLDFEERVFALVGKQVAAGETSRLRQRLAEIEVVQARQAAVAADQDLLEHRLELARLAGMPAAEPPLPVTTLERLVLPSQEELVRQARTRAPLLRALAARTRESGAAVDVADKQGSAQPELGAAYVREGSTPVAGPVSHSILATLALPLPLWFRNQGERAATRAERDVANARLDAASDALEVDVARLRSRVEASRQRLDIYEGSVIPGLGEHLKLLEKALVLGEIDIFDVATMRARALEAQRDALAARAAYTQAVTELEALIGYELTPAAREGAP
jgi:cobalt-zinc-cadmium efflux system outer membrane protein